MATQLFFAPKADQMYTEGPETLVTRSSSIVVGPLSRYSRSVLSSSEPSGPNSTPLKWIVNGIVLNPMPLKGKSLNPVTVSRPEQSSILPISGNTEDWERKYGDLQDGSLVVVFFGDDSNHQTVIKTIASGSGERDIVRVVKDVVLIQSIPDKQLRIAAWVRYFESSPLSEARKAALRSLLRERADWQTIAAALDRANASLNGPLRAYVFGLVSFGIMEGHWAGDELSAVEFIAHRFELEESPEVLLEDILTLKLVLRFTTEDDSHRTHEHLRLRIVASLRRRESRIPANSELAEQYREIRAAYPGLL